MDDPGRVPCRMTTPSISGSPSISNGKVAQPRSPPPAGSALAPPGSIVDLKWEQGKEREKPGEIAKEMLKGMDHDTSV